MATERGDVPFFLGDGKMVIGAKEEKVDTRWTGDGVVVDFPMYSTRIEAKRAAGGALTGAWRSTSKPWGETEVKLTAKEVAGPDASGLFEMEGVPVDLGEATTVWRVKTAESGDAKVVLEQTSPGGFFATIYFESGNIVHMGGTARGDEVRLGAFDGTSPYLLTAKLAADRKSFAGRWTSGQKMDWREDVTATRGPDFELRPKVRPKTKGIVLDLEQLAPYKGKPVIVELAGSWCHTCARAAPFLVELYEKYHPRGLEILTLSYEFTDDAAYNRAQAEKFRREYGLPWSVVPIHGAVEDAFDIIPSELTDVDASGFPIAIFVRRDGTVLDVHAGFPVSQAGAGNEYDKVSQRYEEQVRTLLEDSAP